MGVPRYDRSARIIVFPGGRIIFAELKRPGLKDGRSERQKKVCRLLEKLGCEVRRIGGKEEFEEMMRDAGFTKGGDAL